MRRSNKKSSKKKVPGTEPRPSRFLNIRNAAMRSAENQIAVRGSKKLAASTYAYGVYLQNRPDYRVVRKQHAARYNRQGRVIVGAHEQRTIIFTKTEKGRNFKKSDGSSKARLAMGRRIVWGGKLIPVLGYGYAVHNILGGDQVVRKAEGHPIGAAAWMAHDIKQAGLGNSLQALRDSLSPLSQYERMKEVKPFWK